MWLLPTPCPVTTTKLPSPLFFSFSLPPPPNLFLHFPNPLSLFLLSSFENRIERLHWQGKHSPPSDATHNTHESESESETQTEAEARAALQANEKKKKNENVHKQTIHESTEKRKEKKARASNKKASKKQRREPRGQRSRRRGKNYERVRVCSFNRPPTRLFRWRRCRSASALQPRQPSCRKTPSAQT